MSKRTTTGNTKVAVGYVRVSTDEQNLGPEAQRQAIEAWAARNGVVVVAWHDDHGVSGAAPIEKRTGLLAALDALAELDAGVLVIAKRDRLARDVVASAMIERLATRNGARIVSAAGEGTDDDDPSSMLMRRMVDAFAEYERQIIKARTRAALGVKKARGERVGTISYGYQLAEDGRTLVPNAGEQAIIAKVREARAAGVTFRAIVAELAAAGVVSRKGTPLGLAQVAGMVG
jgi:DNA invertase Pin-like site-specific DNA recombinase